MSCANRTGDDWFRSTLRDHGLTEYTHSETCILSQVDTHAHTHTFIHADPSVSALAQHK